MQFFLIGVRFLPKFFLDQPIDILVLMEVVKLVGIMFAQILPERAANGRIHVQTLFFPRWRLRRISGESRRLTGL
jgi:hypothetical protein